MNWYKNFFTLFVFIALACNLPSTSLTPNENSQIENEVTQTAEASEELPVASLLEFYSRNVRDGIWQEDEGLIILLKAALGENQQTLVIPESISSDLELSDITTLAFQYTQNGINEASKAEITRLLNLLFPTEERLLEVSIPESDALLQPSNKVSAPTQQVDCSSFWRQLDYPQPLPTCFLYAQESISGQDHRIYFPLAYRGDDTKVPYYEAAKQALRDSVQVYSEYGEMPRVYFVFIPNLATDGTTNYLLRAGVSRFRSNESCPVLVFSHAFTEGIEDFKQVLAHELFHCFQVKNIEQYRATNPETTHWFTEGSATYFSNVVYPETDHEYRELNDLAERTLRLPLYQWGYQSFHFFQHMGNRWGNEKVIETLKAMPLTGSMQDQLNALIAYPEMIDLFESYAQNYLAVKVTDTSGSIHPYEIIYGKVVIIDGTLIGDIPHKPFVLYREKFIYTTPNLNYTFTTNASRDTVRIGTAPVDFPVWKFPSWQVDTSCSEWEYMVYSVGITNDPLGRLESYQFNTTEIAEEKPCDECLVGTWQIDGLSYTSYANSLFPRRQNPPIAVGWNGHMFMEYTADGKAILTSENFTVYYKNSFPDPNGGRPIQANLELAFIGTGAVTYSADVSSITYSGGRARIEAKGQLLLPDGTRTNYNVNPSAFGAGGMPASENYVCKGNYLAIFPNLPPSVPNTPEPIFFYRFAPPTP